MREDFVGVISNYNIGFHKQRTDRCLIKVRDVDNNVARGLIGYKVLWPINVPKLILKITKHHGFSVTLLIKFKKCVPGQALGTEVRIMK